MQRTASLCIEPSDWVGAACKASTPSRALAKKGRILRAAPLGALHRKGGASSPLLAAGTTRPTALLQASADSAYTHVHPTRPGKSQRPPACLLRLLGSRPSSCAVASRQHLPAEVPGPRPEGEGCSGTLMTWNPLQRWWGLRMKYCMRCQQLSTADERVQAHNWQGGYGQAAAGPGCAPVLQLCCVVVLPDAHVERQGGVGVAVGEESRDARPGCVREVAAACAEAARAVRGVRDWRQALAAAAGCPCVFARCTLHRNLLDMLLAVTCRGLGAPRPWEQCTVLVTCPRTGRRPRRAGLRRYAGPLRCVAATDVQRAPRTLTRERSWLAQWAALSCTRGSP